MPNKRNITVSRLSRQGQYVGRNRQSPLSTDLTVSPTCQRRFVDPASPAGTALCLTAGGAQRNPWNSDPSIHQVPQGRHHHVAPCGAYGQGVDMLAVSCATLAYGYASSHPCGVSTPADSSASPNFPFSIFNFQFPNI
jgi:hypothetical protein